MLMQGFKVSSKKVFSIIGPSKEEVQNKLKEINSETNINKTCFKSVIDNSKKDNSCINLSMIELSRQDKDNS